MTIFTIGHSTRTFDAFVELLDVHGVQQVADIRSFPHSRRHPQFEGAALAVSLPARGVAYRHLPALGGRRPPRPDSLNTAWQNAGFRGYADYMQTPAFARGLDDLMAMAGEAETAIMCAEAVWWRCHRRLVADALLVAGLTGSGSKKRPAIGDRNGASDEARAEWSELRGVQGTPRLIDVRHIVSTAAPAVHQLTEFARIEDGRISYPGLF